MGDKEKLIDSIIELIKECNDLELLYFVQGLLVTADH